MSRAPEYHFPLPLKHLFIHSAPPVVYPLGRSRFQAGVLGLIWLAGAVLMLAWWRTSAYGGGGLVAGLVAVVISGGFAWKSHRIAPVGKLAWDGQEWRIESEGLPSASTAFDLVVLADFQLVVLLRLQNLAGAKLWLWLDRTAMPERWMDMRRAIYCRPSSHAGQPFPPGEDSREGPVPSPSVAVSAHAASESPLLKP